MTATTEPIYCEFCNVPHRSEVKQCDQCGHWLGTRPDIATLEAQRQAHLQKMILGVLTILVMIALNLMFFGGAAFILLTAPIGWVALSGYRYSNITSGLRTYQQRHPNMRENERE